jgi:hypothetical protein
MVEDTFIPKSFHHKLFSRKTKKNRYALVEEIKVVSWTWSLARLKLNTCLYYEWVWDPGECLLRKS